MNFGDFLKNLALDAWYKVILNLGGFVFVLSIFLPVQGLSSRQVQAISGGSILLGLGVWMDQKEDTAVQPPNVYTGGHALVLTRHYWAPGLGLLPAIGGVALIVLGVLAVIC